MVLHGKDERCLNLTTSGIGDKLDEHQKKHLGIISQHLNVLETHFLCKENYELIRSRNIFAMHIGNPLGRTVSSTRGN